MRFPNPVRHGRGDTGSISQLVGPSAPHYAQAVWAGGRFVIFQMVHRAESIGEVKTVAFATYE
jgi:hypothetical protein